MEILLIDGIGPFFRRYRKKRINWSKIPFSHIETETGIREEYLESVPGEFTVLAGRVAAMGYNAITLDDAAHLIPHEGYPPAVRAKIEAYRLLHGELFAIAASRGLSPYLTTDVMFFHPVLEKEIGRNPDRIADFLAERIERLFEHFPLLEGIIFRFGEADGVDVEGDFSSRIVLRRPTHARRFLERLLPVFERAGKTLVFRTWSLGAYPLGDLMWNRNTFDRVFDRLDSPSLVLSMKYGESDFFRYLPINKLFFRSAHRKIVEFQARREYEGFGAYPSFVGWDCERYLDDLRGARNIVGVSVWCQTGGWGKRRQLTFLRNSSVWVELNAFVIPRLRGGATCEQAIREFCAVQDPPLPEEPFREFLHLSEVAIRKLLYVSELAERKLFFRRLRLPPQLFVFWDRILVNHTIERILRCLVEDGERCIREGEEGLRAVERMRCLAAEHGLPRKGLAFQYETYRILAAAREYFFRPFSDDIAERLTTMCEQYRTHYRRHYTVDLDFRRSPVPTEYLRWLLRILLRDRRGYRIVDQLVTLRLLSWIHPLLRGMQRRVVPNFAKRHAMGVEVFFK
jgi:hypothetical protein